MVKFWLWIGTVPPGLKELDDMKIKIQSLLPWNISVCEVGEVPMKEIWTIWTTLKTITFSSGINKPVFN